MKNVNVDQAAIDFDRPTLEQAIAAGGRQFRADFADWLQANRHVWDRFKEEADKIRRRGRTHYSARTIIEVLRHESALADAGKEFKINDHNTPDLARLYMLTTPGMSAFFSTRVLRNSERAECLS